MSSDDPRMLRLEEQILFMEKDVSDLGDSLRMLHDRLDRIENTIKGLHQSMEKMQEAAEGEEDADADADADAD